MQELITSFLVMFIKLKLAPRRVAPNRLTIHAENARDRTLRDPAVQELVDIGLFPRELTDFRASARWTPQTYPLALFARQGVPGAQRDQIALNLGGQAKGKGQHFGTDRVAQLIAFLHGVDLDLLFHEGVEDAHHLQERAAQPTQL